MADEERDTGLSAVDDETDASDDTDESSSNGGSEDVSTAADEPAQNRVTPRDETVTDGSVDADEPDDAATASVTGADAGMPEDTASELRDDDTPSVVDDNLEDDGLLGGAPESDQEMPLTAHIEEMIRRLAVVFGVAGLITLILFPGADILNAMVDIEARLGITLPSATDVINFLWNSHIPDAANLSDRRPRLYGPLELILTKLKVAGLAGTVIGLPVFVYETYLFMRPGLYPKERKYYLAAVPTSLVLALVGVAFSHFIVLPALFEYLTSYTQDTAVVAFGLKETFNLILVLMGYMAIVFQIPLFIELAIMMNLVTRQWLEDRRLLFWGAFAGLAFLVSPDPTGMAPIMIAATMIALFEGTLAALRWTGN
ncbi:preprotein translocase subunit TatC [Haloferax mediterranei ATCC 33500]|uniref:Sec-independent protein translocase protein TatC n=1 Tax=Haloferax mediterranei (strain ATCC 33500 / DSM 1411 / JCM 8866 / NBRC 14739 / NCIMB 2177 / R-4) TaxID=523841 RepID=I3R116_HALMT|nr:twin-arginine translocase subunit TatC [Haloferax mediterranei]AFK17926.1 sec-independent protein translocase component TatC1 [Haloferax mediterranei ATCC 33500]AHZ22652.1 preprotein translocase subunit TatC [Haloferax mediterranei ATCC 33500]EMA02797.1 sec-independent protein translocase component TatC1 [Haloferax mediterranei ATCC 33500]MDX5988018.1 twin-arginine translocase subunit TatC [Haloferax mediterranei ATCC 33500]QCQ74480.1 preprotein translocase subunit TatC [Haloferax mediterra